MVTARTVLASLPASLWIALITGISIIGQLYQASWIAAGGVFCIAETLHYLHRYPRLLIIPLSYGIAALIVARTASVELQRIQPVQPYLATPCTLRGIIEGPALPSVAMDNQRMQRRLFYAHEIDSKGITQTLKPPLRLSLSCPTTISLSPGECLTLHRAFIRSPPPAPFTYKEYIGGTVTIWDTSTIERGSVGQQSWPSFLSGTIDTVRQRLVTTAYRSLHKESFTLFSTIFLGLRANHTTFRTIKESFEWWGISHMLARSGLHVVFIVTILMLFLSWIPCTYRSKHLFIIFLQSRNT